MIASVLTSSDWCSLRRNIIQYVSTGSPCNLQPWISRICNSRFLKTWKCPHFAINPKLLEMKMLNNGYFLYRNRQTIANKDCKKNLIQFQETSIPKCWGPWNSRFCNSRIFISPKIRELQGLPVLLDFHKTNDKFSTLIWIQGVLAIRRFLGKWKSANCKTANFKDPSIWV